MLHASGGLVWLGWLLTWCTHAHMRDCGLSLSCDHACHCSFLSINLITELPAQIFDKNVKLRLL